MSPAYPKERLEMFEVLPPEDQELQQVHWFSIQDDQAALQDPSYPMAMVGSLMFCSDL